MLSPLTLEEKVDLGGLLRHDYKNELAIFCNRAMAGCLGNDEDYSFALIKHLGDVLDAFTYLTSDRKLFAQRASKSNFEDICSSIRNVLELQDSRFSVHLDVPVITTVESVIHVALYNLVKNSFKAYRPASVRVDFSIFSGRIPDLEFLPENADSAGNFMRVAVTDNGPGFPEGKKLSQYLELGESTGGNGFGLFFVKMAAKYLQAPLAIHSEPGNTSVSLYHPLNLE